MSPSAATGTARSPGEETVRLEDERVLVAGIRGELPLREVREETSNVMLTQQHVRVSHLSCLWVAICRVVQPGRFSNASFMSSGCSVCAKMETRILGDVEAAGPLGDVDAGVARTLWMTADVPWVAARLRSAGRSSRSRRVCRG